MANVPPAGSGPTSMQNDPNYSATPLSWEGDKMFNIYIYDYCFKRGFRKTARELLAEAEIPPESQPPINARQGLLFEWWSVFWVLFTAKANGSGNEDAVLYTQHQSTQVNNRPRGPPGPPGQPIPGRMPVNGMPPSANRPFPANGSMPNGVGPPSAGHSFPHGGPHMNGIPPNPPNQPGQNFPPGPPPMPGQPRTSITGGNPRGSNGGPPFPSPTMAHSPHNPGSGAPHPSQQPPMNQLGQSPHLGPRAMAPPNGMQGIPQSGPGSMQGQPGPYPMAGRPPSRTASPGQMGGMMHRSPSLNARQPPNMMGGDPRDQELKSIPPHQFNQYRDEVGLNGKDLSNMTPEEKQRVLQFARTRRKPGPPNAAAGPSTMPPPQQQRGRTAGKRNSTSPREDPDNAPGIGSPPNKKPRRSPENPQYPPHPTQQMMPGQPSGPGAMNGPGPGGPGGPGSQQQPMGLRMGPMNSGFPPQMGGGPGQGQGPMNMGVPPMGGNGGPPHAMSPSMSANTMMTPQMQPQQMGLSNRPPPQTEQYRNNLANFHRSHVPNAANSPSDPSFGAPGGPNQQPPPFAPGAPNSGPGPNNRMTKPGGMPPPSPGMNKDLSKDINMKAEGSPRTGSGMTGPGSGPGGLGMNPPPSAGLTPTATGTSSSTPVPPGSSSQSQNPTPSNSAGPPQGVPPPPSSLDSSSMMGGMMSSGPQGNPAPMGPELFAADFMNMNDITSGLEFDPAIFRDSGDLNFERDFGQWFNPDEIGGSLDSMK